MAARLGTAVLYLNGDDSNLKKSLGGVEGTVKKAFGGAAGFLGNALSFATGGVILKGIEGITGSIGDLGKSIITEALNAERGQAQLNAVIASTGGVAGVTAEQVGALSDKIAGIAPVEDDAITGAQSMLLTFTNIGKKVFPDATQAAIDMAFAMNNGATPSAEELSNKAMLVGKALNDPIAGMAALSKVGVKLTEDQKAQITALLGTTAEMKKMGQASEKATDALPELKRNLATATLKLDEMTKGGKASASALSAQRDKITTLKEDITGAESAITRYTNAQKTSTNEMSKAERLMEAQKIILGELATEFGGSAKAAGQTFGGQMEILNNQIGNVKESIGTAMLPALQQLATAFGPMLVSAMQNLASWITTTLMPAFSNVVTWITTNWPLIQTTITTAIANIRAFVEPIIGVLVGLFQQTGDKTTWLGQTWSQIAGVITMAATLIQTIVTTVFNAIKGFIQAHGTEIQAIVTAVWTYLQTTITNLLTIIQGVINLVLSLIKGDWSGAWSALLQIAGGIFDQIKNVITTALTVVQGAFGILIDLIVKKYGPAFQSLKDNILTPVANAFQDIGNAIDRVIGFIADMIKKLAQINLPGWLTPGSPTPFELGLRGIGNAMADLTQTQLPAFGGGLQMAPALAGGGNTFNVTVNASGGDPQAIGLAVTDAVRRAARSMGGTF